jgi:Mn2+/Fe2+ NRAMP family transporter
MQAHRLCGIFARLSQDTGIVAVPIMAVMMVVVTRLSVMGRFSAKPVLTFFGWAGTALMAVTVVALFWSSFG